MDPVSILETWLKPITEPLKELGSQIEALSSVNQGSVNTFNTLTSDLTDASMSNAFTGPAADAVATMASEYVTTEAAVANTTALTAGPVAEAVDVADTMVTGIMDAIFTASTEVTDTGPLETITATVDAAALVQGGVDLPNTAVAVGLTGIEAIALIGILIQFAGTLFFIWMTWQNAMNDLSQQNYPALPDKPKPVQHPSNQVDPLVEEILQMKEFKDEGFDPALVEELYRLGYSKDEIIRMLRAIKQNKSYLSEKPGKQQRAINFALQALIDRSLSEFASSAYKDLKGKGFTEVELRDIVASNDLSLAEVLIATERAQSSGLYQELKNAGLSDGEIHSMLGTMTKDDMGNAGVLNRMQAYLTRLQQAQANGHDQHGLTEQQLHDLLFHPDQGIVSALLSGDNGKIAEGKVAVSIIEEVTLFDIKYGPNGSIGQIDIGTNMYIIEVKQGGVSARVAPQIQRLIANDTINPLVNGQRKRVILFAPDYNSQGAEELKEKYNVEVIRSWNELRKFLGLPPLTNH